MLTRSSSPIHRDRVSAIAILVLTALLAISNCSAQVERDPGAVAALMRSVEALGGLPRAEAIRSVVASGGITSNSGTIAFAWKDRFGDGHHEFRREIGTPDRRYILTSNHGKPKRQTGSQRQPVGRDVLMVPAYHVPIRLLFSFLQNQQWSLQLVDDKNPSLIHARIFRKTVQIDPLSEQNWYIDADTGLPRTVIYRALGPGREPGYVSIAVDLREYREIEGMKFPTVIVVHDGSDSIYTVKDIRLDQVLSVSDFELQGADQ